MMNKALHLVLAVFVALLLATAACSGSNITTDQSPTPTETPAPTVTSGETVTPEHSLASPPDLASISLVWALANGKPTLAEFGWRTCIPCKQMKPILEELAIEYEGRLDVVIVEVYEHKDLARQYGIMAIPTQIFFDDTGQEITRHMGFWPKEEILAQLKEMEIQ